MTSPLRAPTTTARLDLSQGWTVRPLAHHDERIPVAVREAGPIPAAVPGVVHTDLLAAGLIPDPYLDRNELEVEWVGLVDWVYELSFEHRRDPAESVDLEFDGLDTVATVELNGVHVAATENMHRRYRFPVSRLLRDGTNRLTVRFDSAVRFAQGESERLGDLPRQYPLPFNFIRKSACNFGWDWGPSLVSCGIWRPVRLVLHRQGGIAEVLPRVRVEDGTGIVDVEVRLREPAASELVLRIEAADARGEVAIPVGAESASARLTVADPPLWWPRGLGEPALTELRVRTVDPAGVVCDSWSGRIGFRTVGLDTAADADGSSFALTVNGVPVPVRGANWIPDDCFFPRVTPERLRRRIGQAADAELNLLRVWGGGSYESDEFYRVCDETGVLVWQDFLFACAAYPEEERLRNEVELEARDNVARLLPHPSLVLWNGNNENIWGEQDWNWRPAIAGRAWGLGYYLDLLPRVVAETDPDRPYWPGSPYSGDPAIHPNDPAHGTQHLWDVWNEFDYSVYRHHRPRFVAEFGWQGPPAWSTLIRAVHDEPLLPDSPGLLHHQKAEDGAAKLERGIARHLPPPRTTDDWHYAAQLIQARAVRTGIEWFRSLRPLTSGTILWQLNDCWPVTSWAVIDGDGRRKAAWYALRAASRPRLLTLQPGETGPELVALNDERTAWSATLSIRRMTVDGELLARHDAELEVAVGGVARVALPPHLALVDPGREFLVAEAGGDPRTRALWCAEERDLAHPDAPYQVSWAREGDDVLLEFRVSGLARGVTLFPDRIAAAAEAEESDLDLIPGETRVIRVAGIPAGREDELVRPPVLRQAGELFAAQQAVAAP